MVEAQIAGGVGHQGIDRRIAGETENILGASLSARSILSTRP
jgi:hypothetical protein